ncbi:hypothetical protein H2248_011883 [Termitomyces sp. 'cryptogamus']|nr:hypothetical protein H2248_011883 [Termitomyces sp. 'cryptogamus']
MGLYQFSDPPLDRSGPSSFQPYRQPVSYEISEVSFVVIKGNVTTGHIRESYQERYLPFYLPASNIQLEFSIFQERSPFQSRRIPNQTVLMFTTSLASTRHASSPPTFDTSQPSTLIPLHPTTPTNNSLHQIIPNR